MKALSFLLFASLTACATAASENAERPALTIAEVRSAVDSMKREGDVVWVRGYISKGCYSLGCEVADTLALTDKTAVSIAGDSPLEPQIRRLAGKRVTMRVKINKPRSYTSPDGDIIISTDRASEVIPMEIQD
jgi:hypothetical protein